MKNTADKFSSICIGGGSSGDGKTTVTIALLRALYRRGLKVQPFKCGPDYIDPTFHRIACERQACNLDGWMMGAEAVKKSFGNACIDADCAVIEGVMGLFDSSAPGTLDGSTAQIASLVKSKVILTVNARGMANSIAALVKGYSEFNRDIEIIGVIANKVGSKHHAELLKEALKLADLPPLLGFLPRNNDWGLPERHLGLVPFLENEKTDIWFDDLANAAEKYFDIDRILELSRMPEPAASKVAVHEKDKVKLAVAMDKAFHFYYRDNLELLEKVGFELMPFSPLTDKSLPENCDAVYIGGGFPEEFADRLAANSTMRQSLKDFAGTILAECGGYMYLSESVNGRSMCGIVPAKADMDNRLRSLGYRQARTLNDSFLGPAGTLVRGHEFHWSNIDESDLPEMWNCTRADGNPVGNCGFFSNNIIASYIHIHFASNPGIANNWYNYTKRGKGKIL